MTKKRSRGRRTSYFALAASIAVGALALWAVLRPVPDTAPELVGIVAAATGTDVRRNGLSVPDTGALKLMSGDTLTVGPGARVRLLLESGAEIRLNEGTEIALAAIERIHLKQGSVYFDSAGLAEAAQFNLDTPWGQVVHVGTQYMVQLLGESLAVSVREGAVRLTDDGGLINAGERIRAGQRIHVDEQGGRVEQIEGYGPAWDWVLALAPPRTFSTVADALVWISRETGYELHFESEEAESAAQGEPYSLPDSKPKEALDALLTPFSLLSVVVTLDGGQLLVSEAEQ